VREDGRKERDKGLYAQLSLSPLIKERFSCLGRRENEERRRENEEREGREGEKGREKGEG
jgi:hypothetical protein